MDSILIAALVAVVIGFCAWWAWDLRRHDRELGQRAWQDWIDRVGRIGRQYGMSIEDDPVWRNYFGKRMSPDEAVRAERERRLSARELAGQT